MKKQLLTLTLILNSAFSFANCIDLSGTFAIEDMAKDCTVSRNGDVIFAHSGFPIINIMAKPGENYGYMLNQLVTNDMHSISIDQASCENIRITSTINENKSLLIEQGVYPYFGARSPITVEIGMDQSLLSQRMLITKYTMIADGAQKVYKDLKYASEMKLDSQDNLIVKAGVTYGRKNNLHEIVECIFKRR